MRGHDIIGNIAILKFSRETKLAEKKKKAEKFLKEHKSVKTVLEKTEKFKGRLRKYVVGDKTKEALYRENNCVFRLNVDSCYFSPRLSSERKEVAKKVKPGESKKSSLRLGRGITILSNFPLIFLTTLLTSP